MGNCAKAKKNNAKIDSNTKFEPNRQKNKEVYRNELKLIHKIRTI